MPSRALLALVLCVLPAAAQPCQRGFSAPDRIITDSRVRSAVYGDFDEDGRVDVAFESTYDLAVSLNRGEGVFEPASRLSLPVWTRDVNGVTDLDRDGHLDLLFGRPISVWARGHGDGTFEAPLPVVLPDNALVNTTELVDFDHDGFLDIAAWSSSGVVRFLRAAENGTFVETTRVGLAGGSADTAAGRGVGDFDGDGNVDAVSVIRDRSNNRSSVSFVWSATTAAPIRTVVPVPFDTHGLWDVDADGDGSDDLFGVAGDQLAVLHFTDRVLTHELIPFPGEPRTIPINPFSADVDGDGRRDLLFGYEFSVGFARGLDGGGFAEPMFLGAAAANEYTHADIDGDGRQDVVTIRGSEGLSVLYAGSPAFRSPTQRLFPIAFGAVNLQVADFNGDGRKDVVGAGGLAHFATVLINDGAGFFRLGSALTMKTNVGVGTALAIGDFDGDGHLDLAAGPNDATEAVNPLVAFGDGTGAFPERIALPRALVTGSLRTSSTGRPSVLVIQDGEVRTLQVNRAGEVSVTPLFPIGTDTSVRVFDLDGDGIDEIAVKTPSTIDILKRNGVEWTAIHHLVPATLYRLKSVEATDVNGDHVDDLLVKTINDAVFYLRTGSGYGPPHTIPSRNFHRDATVADVDDDGHPDLIAASGGGDETARAGMIEVRRGDGLGTFTPYNTALGTPGGSTLAMDMDGDGAVDLLSTVTGGVELNRNVCVTPRVRAAATPQRVTPGNPVKLVVHALSTDSFAIGTITIKQGGVVVAREQPGRAYEYATTVWTSGPMPEGQHVFTIEYNDQFSGLSSTTLTVDVRENPPRRRALRH
jgi:hypothetical protein